VATWLLIGVGGAVGALLRYGISGWVQQGARSTFPWGTMAVNVLGCLLMGALARALFDASVLRPEYRMAILVGGLGAFTTFSTFGYDTLGLLNDGQVRQAAFYVLGTNAACLVAVWLGYRVVERLTT